MKTIMIPIKPQYAALEMNGKKTIEVRKFYIEPPFKVVNYVTKAKGKSQGKDTVREDWLTTPHPHIKDKNVYVLGANYGECLNGTVAFEYVVNKVDKEPDYAYYKKYLYAWHISDLKIYDKPKEITEYYRESGTFDDNDFILQNKINEDGKYIEHYMKYIKRPPQNYIYVEDLSEV